MKNQDKRIKSLLWCGIAGLLLALFLWEFRDLWGLAILFLLAGAFGVLFTHFSIGNTEKKRKQEAEAVEQMRE